MQPHAGGMRPPSDRGPTPASPRSRRPGRRRSPRSRASRWRRRRSRTRSIGSGDHGVRALEHDDRARPARRRRARRRSCCPRACRTTPRIRPHEASESRAARALRTASRRRASSKLQGIAVDHERAVRSQALVEPCLGFAVTSESGSDQQRADPLVAQRFGLPGLADDRMRRRPAPSSPSSST